MIKTNRAFKGNFNRIDAKFNKAADNAVRVFGVFYRNKAASERRFRYWSRVMKKHCSKLDRWDEA